MSYQPFPIVEVAVASLHLDLNNFRIEDVLPSESAAITYLFAEHDVKGLARQILLEGYVDNELILAVKDGGKYVVLEGNRRATALKALLDPSIAPGESREYLETLKRRHEIEAENLPTDVRVMVAPSRDATRMLLARLHLGTSKNIWGRDAQARFVIAQLEAGMSLTTIRQELPGINNPSVYIRQYHVRKILKEANFTDQKLAKYAASSRLKMTSFEYAYGNPDIQKVLGLSFDKDGVPTSIPSTRKQLRALERLVGLFESKELNTRKFPKRSSETYDEDMKSLISKLAGDLASPVDEPTDDPSEATGDSDVIDGAGDAGGATGAEGSTAGQGGGPGGAATGDGGSSGGFGFGGQPGGTGGRGPNNPDTLKSLHVTVAYGHAPVGLRKRLNELRSLDVANYAVATAMLMRSVVEASIKWHFAERGTPVSGELGRVMNDVHKAYGSRRPLKNVIDLLRDDSGKYIRPGSLRWFNMAAHDANHAMDAQSVRDAWQNVEHFIGFMLTPAPAAPSP
ncbi:hypothetical protein QFZ53_002735 [Microbacterium natoriense]|uniref:ParB/Sulfiredoxin domain-containing protein n=1 Tax=Microbacterium natoriense TaxID=284570 RepID=A0AAW8F0Y5_9MICO|nr:hypothetical protein [Microbacterium natoriense]MDQ0648539.1 hypothetical protein [Microbacterium natoriense]